MINTPTESATGKEYLVSDVIDSLKRLERVGSETSKTTEKLIQAAAELSREICRHLDGFEDGFTVADVGKKVEPRTDRYSSPIPCTETLTPWRAPYRVSKGKLYMGECLREYYVANNRENALKFSGHVAAGLLDAVADTIERAGRDSEAGLSVLEKREQTECLRAVDKEEFAAAIASARSFWKRYRALVEAEELPEPYLSEVTRIGGELEAANDPFVG